MKNIYTNKADQECRSVNHHPAIHSCALRTITLIDELKDHQRGSDCLKLDELPRRRE
jgi:hypothetical protein